MAEGWSQIEVEATVSDYLEMLSLDIRGEPYIKAEHNRNLQRMLNYRTKAAVELKHQNISAILLELGFPYIDGYKPRGNYQRLLFEVVEQRIARSVDFQKMIAVTVEQKIEAPKSVGDVLSILVPAPHTDQPKPRLYDKPSSRPIRINYLEIEARNQALGIAGETLALEFEQKRLWTAGRKDLSDRIQHVSRTLGDQFGYDIVSFETDGRDKLIEVKTTRFGEQTPFFASRNEVGVSVAREKEYHLYRLYNFTKQPKLFVLPGSLRNSCRLEPTQYSAVPI